MVDLLQVLYTGLPTKHPNFFHIVHRFEADDDFLVKSNVSHTIALLKQILHNKEDGYIIVVHVCGETCRRFLVIG